MTEPDCMHINTGGSRLWLRMVRHCPTCDKRRRFTGMEQLYYGPTWTCCGCGDSWSDGEQLPRPFARSWRAEAVATNSPEAIRWLHDQMAKATF